MAPDWALLPLVILATVATVIASQAVITGAFSVTQQAIQLGLLPRMEIQYTSDVHAGQIYLPDVNRLLLIGILLLVFMFQTSSNLASAYGIAVTGSMTGRHAPGLHRDLEGVALAPAAGGRRSSCPFLFVDGAFLVGEPRQGARRRLRAADDRGRRSSSRCGPGSAACG